MLQRRRASRLAAFILALSAIACGGSSSESPWPIEPIDTEPGPAGEQRPTGNVVDTKKLPEKYGEGGAAASDDGSEDESREEEEEVEVESEP